MQTPSDMYSRIQATEDLVHAAGHGRLEPLRSALERGGSVNHVRSDQGALMTTVSGRHLDCARLLLEHGADVRQKTRTWWTSMHEAAQKDFPEFIPVLAEAGGDVDARDAGGTTPLLAAIQARSMGAAKALLATGAEPNVVDYDGLSSLMAAVIVEDAGMLEALLAAGADKALVNAKGASAMDMAQASGWALGIQMLGLAPTAPTPVKEAGLASPTQDQPAVSRIGKRKPA